MILLKRGVGRLFTARFLAPVLDEEWDQFEDEVLEVVKAAPSQVIFCTDLRGATVFTDKVSERFIAAMRANSPKISRAAVLLPSEGAILSLQFERIVREVGYAWRRTFRSPREARMWLGEVLLPAEQESLLGFLAEWVPGSRPPPPPLPTSRPPPPPGSRPSAPGSRPPAPGSRPPPSPSTPGRPGGAKPSGGGKG